MRDLDRIFGLGPLARIVLASLTVILVVFYLARQTYGPLELDWVWLAGVSILFGLGTVLVALLPGLMPPRIAITERGIVAHTLRGDTLIRFTDLESVAVQSTAAPVLRVARRTGHGKQQLEYGIADTVDLAALTQALECGMQTAGQHTGTDPN